MTVDSVMDTWQCVDMETATEEECGECGGRGTIIHSCDWSCWECDEAPEAPCECKGGETFEQRYARRFPMAVLGRKVAA